jgi:hypothetical protein
MTDTTRRRIHETACARPRRLEGIAAGGGVNHPERVNAGSSSTLVAAPSIVTCRASVSAPVTAPPMNMPTAMTRASSCSLAWNPSHRGAKDQLPPPARLQSPDASADEKGGDGDAQRRVQAAVRVSDGERAEKRSS